MGPPRSSSTANGSPALSRSIRSGRLSIAHWRPRVKSRPWRALHRPHPQWQKPRPEIRRAIRLPRRMLLHDAVVGKDRCAVKGGRLRPASLYPARHMGAVLALLGLMALAGVSGCTKEHGPDVVAMVNGKPIMRPDTERLYKTNLGESKQEPPKDQADNVRLNIVREQIDEEIVDQRAAKLNLTATDDEVETKLAEMKAPYTQEEFDQRLKGEHLTLDDLKKEIRRSRTEEKLFNKEINSKINITDGDITNYYNTHKADFDLVEPRYHLAEIAVTPQPAPAQQQQPINMQNSKASNDAEAKKKIEGLHSRLESGEDFATLAANFSEDPNTASNGGDAGGIVESALRRQPEIFEAINKLSPGQITPVLALPAGPGSNK